MRLFGFSQPQCLLVAMLFGFSDPACGDAIRFLTVLMPAWRLSSNFDTSCWWSPFFIYLCVFRYITNTKKDSFKWRKFLYRTQAIHWKISKSLARNHEIFKSPRLLTFEPFLPNNSQVSVGTYHRSQTTCYEGRVKTIVILQENHSHKKGLKLTELLNAQ